MGLFLLYHQNNSYQFDMEKHEWRKKEKELYLPRQKPVFINVPPFNFITISGKGNPNNPEFTTYISALYPIAYSIKMTLKKMTDVPKNYVDYTGYPLEGVWDITEEAKKNFNGKIDKNDLVFKLMLRQPNFITKSFFEEMLALSKVKKPQPLFDNLKFETIKEGKCIQMLHVGPYDDEPTSFKIMENFAVDEGLKRVSKIHREIYLSDFRKVAPEKLKTVLRFKVF